MIEFQQILAAVAAFVAVLIVGLLIDRRDRSAASSTPVGSSDAPWSSGTSWILKLLPPRWKIRMERAGLSQGTPQVAFVGVLLVSSIAGLVLGTGFALLMDWSSSMRGVSALIGIGVGWWIPQIWLVGREQERYAAMLAEFPVMIDLLEISLQGGLALTAAWEVVASHLAVISPPLAEEMRRIELEVEFGGDWSVSLENASHRTGIDEFRTLGTLLRQSERFGTELTETLRTQSDALRLEERQGLEDRAQRASIILLFPLALMMFPAVLLIVAGPMLFILLENLRSVNP